MKQSIRLWLFLVMAICVIPSCSKLDFWNDGHSNHKADVLPNTVVHEWNLAALQSLGGVTYGNPLIASRTFAMVHIAMHDALNAIVPLYEQYAYHQLRPGADPVLAAAQAAYTVLVMQYPENKSNLDMLLEEYLDATAEGSAKAWAITTGTEAGNAILDMRKDDGSGQDPIGPPAVSNVPGVYNTVPSFTFVFGEFWKEMQPFVMTSVDQFRSVPPPALTSQQYAKDYNDVKSYGSATSTTRSADESFYAAFWYEFVEIGWNSIARVVTEDKNLKLLATARIFALMNMAITDSYTGGWDSKYFYDFWRPYTAIRRGQFDGNNLTQGDGNWLSFLPTPPVPDYPSTHSVGANAAATVLEMLIKGNESFTFSSSSSVPVNSERSFKSFREAADENARSRVMAGIHFRFATEAGQKMGDEIGKWAVKNHLEPLK